MRHVLLDRPVNKQGYLRPRCASGPIPTSPAEVDGRGQQPDREHADSRAEGRLEDETEGKGEEHEQYRERVPEEGGTGQRDEHEEHDEEQRKSGAHGSSDPSALSNAASSRAGSLHPGSSSLGGRISRRRCSSCTLS
jgi:hypothetical protein